MAQRTLVTAKKRQRFINALKVCGNVSEAARSAGVGRTALYAHRKADPAFAADWEAAAELGVEGLEDEARRRAHDGVDEPLTSAKGLIYDADGHPVTVRKYSDTLLIFLLKGARPERYRDNVHVTAPANLGITVILEQMRDDRRIAESAADFVALVDAVGKAEE